MLLSPLTVTSIPSTQTADPDRLGAFALDLQRKANEVCWEMYLFNRNQPEFRETYKATRQIWSLAGNISAALHHGPASLKLVEKNADELDQLFHLIESDVTRWSEAAINRSLPSGSVRLMRRGGNLKTLHTKLHRLNESLHRVTEELGVLSASRERPAAIA